MAKTLVSDFDNQVSRHIEETSDLSFPSFCSSLTMQFIPNYYKHFRKVNDEKSDAAMVKFLQVMEEHITKFGGKFLMGEQIGAADYLLWPWMERLEVLTELLGKSSNSARCIFVMNDCIFLSLCIRNRQPYQSAEMAHLLWMGCPHARSRCSQGHRSSG